MRTAVLEARASIWDALRAAWPFGRTPPAPRPTCPSCYQPTDLRGEECMRCWAERLAARSRETARILAERKAAAASAAPAVNLTPAPGTVAVALAWLKGWDAHAHRIVAEILSGTPAPTPAPGPGRAEAR